MSVIIRICLLLLLCIKLCYRLVLGVNRQIENDEKTSIFSESHDVGIFRFPLISHHELLSRRRRELGLLTNENKDVNLSLYRNREPQYSRRKSVSTVQNHTIAPLFQGYGTHYVDLWVGYPNPQRQTVIVDTGSSITAFPCSDCKIDCGAGYHTDTYFHDDLSATFAPHVCRVGQDNVCVLGYCQSSSQLSPPSLRGYKTDNGNSQEGLCRIGQKYQEGSSWTAFGAKDYVYIGGSHEEPCKEDENNQDTSNDSLILDRTKPASNTLESLKAEFQKEVIEQSELNNSGSLQNNKIGTSKRPKDFRFQLDFACQTKITGLFITQLADGIMGVENSQMSFWSQMYNAGIIIKQQFSLCFGAANEALRSGSSAGAMTLGGVDTRFHKTPMVFAQNIEQFGWFTVQIRAVYLRKDLSAEVIKLDMDMEEFNRDGIIVDSGTTDTYLNSIIKRPFRRAFRALSGVDYADRIMLSSQEDMNALPTVLIQLRAANNSQNSIASNAGVNLARSLDPDHPDDVIVEVTPSRYLTCSRSWNCESLFFMTEESGGVLGANVMTEHDVLFDVDNDRIGFATSDCSYQMIQ